MTKKLPFEELADAQWFDSTNEIVKFSGILDEVIDDASYGWTPHLEDQVHWCVWSAPVSIQVAFRLNRLAGWLMRWEMYKEAEICLRKSLLCGIKLLGTDDCNSIGTLVLLSNAVWKQKRLGEALVFLRTAGEAFYAKEHESYRCDAMRCFVKVAACYDALGWHRLAQDAWDRVAFSL